MDEMEQFYEEIATKYNAKPEDVAHYGTACQYPQDATLEEKKAFLDKAVKDALAFGVIQPAE